MTNTMTETETEIADTTSPVIELSTDYVIYNEEDNFDPMSYVVSATDDSGKDIVVRYHDEEVDFTSPGEYIIHYEASDVAGNKTEAEITVAVRKEYTKDEIKEVIKQLIEDTYYNYDYLDGAELRDEEQIEGAVYDAIGIWGNFDEYVSDFPVTGIWGSDPNIYTNIEVQITVDEGNIGVKNANVDTLNSELLIMVAEESGDTDLYNAESIDVSSDMGRISVDSVYSGGTYVFNEDGYFHTSRTYFCFESEEQINKFREIVESKNVSIKVHNTTNNDKTFQLNQNQCENWCRTIKFYNELNNYINNISK